MLKFYRNVLAAGVVALGLAACGDNVTVTNPPPVTPVVHQVVVVPQSVTASVGQTVTFVASVTADSGISSTAVHWTSTNPAVATVDPASGVVTAVSSGQSTIVAASVADPTKTGAGSITVVAITGLTVSPTNAVIAVGGTLQPTTQISSAPGAPAPTITWASNNTAAATVDPATGTITGVSVGVAVITATATSGGQTFTATIGVTVGSGPVGLISFSVSPSAMTLFAGQSQQDTAKVNPSSIAVTWNSLAPSVATVNSTGLITAVAQGTAIITATIGTAPNTITQNVVVTVGASASVSINSVTGGATAGHNGCPGVVGAPVILTNVACQIDVNLNLSPGVQPLDSVTVWFIQSGVTKKLASQNYHGSIPAGGIITLSVNSANFTKNPATGTATVDLWNGPTTMVATLWPTNGGAGSAINCQIGGGNPNPLCVNLSMVFNNADGWAGDVSLCSGVIATGASFVTCPPANPAGGTGGFATDVGGSGFNTGKTYWGGPGATGQIAAELYAVVYNNNPGDPAGSALNRCATGSNNANATTGLGVDCVSTVSWTIGSTSIPSGHCPFSPMSSTVAPATPLFFQVFGSTGPAVTNNCTGHENILTRRDNILINPGALDANANTFPNGGLIPNTIVFAATPDSFRIDWNPPSFVAQPAVTGAEGFNWVNGIWPFTPGGNLVSDAGVGPAPTTWLAFASLMGGSATTFPTPILTGASFGPRTLAGPPETNTNCTGGAGCDGYTAQATATDLLGNMASSGVTASFGVDLTAPMVRYSALAAPSLYPHIYTSGGSGAVLDSTVYIAIEGVYGANITTPGAQTLFLAAAAGTNDSFRIEAQDNRSGLSRAIENTTVFAQGGATGASSTVALTNNGAFGPSTIDGWLPAPAFHVTNGIVVGPPPANPGYYTTTGYVVDKAGNVSGCPITGNIIGVDGISSICTAAAPSFAAGTNSATLVAGANEFFRRTLALDPAQPVVTGVSPNGLYTGNAAALFTLGAQNDLEVIDARLRLQYPNLTTGTGAATASPGLVWSYALSNAFMSSGFSAGPASGNGTNFGYFTPIALRFDASIINPVLTTLTLDMFTVSIQETCLGAGSPTASCAINGDPIPSTDVPFTKPVMSPNNVAVQVRDVFGSWIFNSVAGALTGVSAEFVSPILSATVPTPSGFSVGYITALLGPTSSCPQGGTVQPAGSTSCVGSGLNFRAEPTLSSAGTKVFRETEPLSVTLPTFTRVDLFGLNAANEWVFIQRCAVPSTIIPNTGAQSCGSATVNGTDNGNERYWLYTFTGVASAGFTSFRALGVDVNGFGLFSTAQP